MPNSNLKCNTVWGQDAYFLLYIPQLPWVRTSSRTSRSPCWWFPRSLSHGRGQWDSGLHYGQLSPQGDVFCWISVKFSTNPSSKNLPFKKDLYKSLDCIAHFKKILQPLNINLRTCLLCLKAMAETEPLGGLRNEGLKCKVNNNQTNLLSVALSLTLLFTKSSGQLLQKESSGLRVLRIGITKSFQE